MDSRRGSITQGMIMGVIMVVILGHVFLWVIMPLKIYKLNWLPEIRAQTASTYFGTQGTTILTYTFPILFIAVLASIYVHLEKRNNCHSILSDGKKLDKMAIWKRPMVMKGLGIVTRTELAFFLMFIALLVWSFYNYLRVSFATITPHMAAMPGMPGMQHMHGHDGQKLWELKFRSASLRLGLVGNIVLAFLFYPVTRGSTILPLFGLTSEASVKYHIWLGHITMTLFTAHSIGFIVYWAITDELSEMLKWDNTGVSNIAGELSLLFGLVLWVTTFPWIRREMFELFFYTHYFYILFVVFFVFHVGVSYSCMMLPGFYLFMVDRFLRFLQSRSGARLVSARVLPCETLELNFSKTQGLNYTPTSIMFINVPSISKQQWHPFTISSSSSLEPEKLSVMIKGEGSWTKKLYQMVSSPSLIDNLNVSVEGPYGPPSIDFLRHDRLVMVSGGSGITPFISIIRELVFMKQTLKLNTPKILLVTAFKNSSDLTMLNLLLPISNTESQISALDLKIEAYVTRENEPKKLENQILTKWFKPSQKDQPISPILGSNTALWLGMIIASSFVIFLLFMGILTRFYIYPIDHNTNSIYSSGSRAVLNMLFVCISIAITASAVFYWNKLGNQRETNQINKTEAATPVGSPGSFYNAERELESFPQESIVQSTTMHYGDRPDVKRILFELKETSVGVLVCGPKKMRQEVAKVCSSGLVDNLRFESISFSW